MDQGLRSTEGSGFIQAKEAAEAGVEVEDYLRKVQSLQEFLKSSNIVARADLMEALETAMKSKQFTLVLGPTRIRQEVVRRLESEGKVTILDVMRERPSEELLQALLAAVKKGTKNPASVEAIEPF